MVNVGDRYIGESEEEYRMRAERAQTRWCGWWKSAAPEHPDIENPDTNVFKIEDTGKMFGDKPVYRLVPKSGAAWKRGETYRHDGNVIVRKWYVDGLEVLVLCYSSGWTRVAR